MSTSMGIGLDDRLVNPGRHTPSDTQTKLLKILAEWPTRPIDGKKKWAEPWQLAAHSHLSKQQVGRSLAALWRHHHPDLERRRIGRTWHWRLRVDQPTPTRCHCGGSLYWHDTAKLTARTDVPVPVVLKCSKCREIVEV